METPRCSAMGWHEAVGWCGFLDLESLIFLVSSLMRKSGRLVKSSIWLELFWVFPKTPEPRRRKPNRTIGNRSKNNRNRIFRLIFKLRTCWTGFCDKKDKGYKRSNLDSSRQP